MRRHAYLDYNATQPLRAAARAAMLEVLEEPSNASSIHRLGQAARHHVERARANAAALIGAEPGEITFTSGATEANVTALRGAGARSVLLSAIEHPSVALACDHAIIAPVTAAGVVDLDALDRLLAEAEAPALVSIMLANNETGVIQPVAEAARIVHAHGALLHSDATQGPGRIALDVKTLDIDLLTISSHKIGGPQGCGALYARSGLSLTPLLRGGGQEGRRRGGTENVAAIAGFGVAAVEARTDLERVPVLAALRDRMESRLAGLAPDLIIFGADAPRLANTSCFGAAGLSAETALIALDLAGICISSGAACSSGAVEPSRVLLAMGASTASARTAIRVSLGWATSPEDLDHLVENWAMVYRRARAIVMADERPPIRERSA